MRRFEFSKGASNKFWEVEVVGSELHLRWGKIGANGQTKQKSLADVSKAEAERDKLIKQKTSKGYAEVGFTASSAVPKKAAAKTAPKKAAAKAAPKKAAAKAAPKKATGPSEAPTSPQSSSEHFVPSVDTLVYQGYQKPLIRNRFTPKEVSEAQGRAARTKAEAILAGTSNKAAGPLFPYLDDAALIMDLIANPKLNVRMALESVDALVDNLANEAIPALVALGKLDWGPHTTSQAIARIRSPEAANYFVGKLDHREVRELARDYLNSVPEFAIGALARSTKALSRSLLSTLVRMHSEILDDVLSSLGAAERDVVIEVRDQGLVDVPDAKQKELPVWFAKPAWTVARKKAKKHVPIVLECIPHSESIVWREGQQALWKNAGDYVTAGTEKGNSGARKKLEASTRLLAEGKKGKMMLYLVLQAEDEVVLEVWNATTAAHWDWAPFDEVQQLVARTGVACLPGLIAFSAKNVANGVELLARFDALPVAAIMVKALSSSSTRARRGARTWLDSFPRTAATALIPISLGAEPKERALAIAGIRYLSQKGNGETVLQLANDYGTEALSAVELILDWDPLQDVPAKIPSLPAWFDPVALPRPLLRGRARALPLQSVRHLAMMLSFSPVDPPYEGILQVKEACDAESLLAFAWALFEAWLGADGKGKTDWAMMSLAHFGGDDAARRLTPLIRKWPGDSQHGRAQRGLDLLAVIGTDIALMHLYGISQKLKYKALKARAAEKVEQIAEARGLSADELGDRLVPDLDLDADGSLRLDFGPRKFRVGFDEQLVPFVMDEQKKRLKNLPKPGKSDDTELGKAATKTFRTLKKDAKTLAKGQILRLELAMCNGRFWSAEVFEMFLMSHPLMRHLVRRLVWGTYDADSELVSTFRVADDGTLADWRDDEFSLAADAIVGLPHPLLLDGKTLAAWGEVFADYELLQPFSQLGRPVHRPTAAEKKAKALTRQKGKVVPTGRIRGMDARGWRKGAPEDAGGIYTLEKKIVGQSHRIVLQFGPGIFAGDASFEESEQILEELYLQPSASWSDKDRIKLGELSPIIFSEMILDLERLWQ